MHGDGVVCCHRVSRAVGPAFTLDSLLSTTIFNTAAAEVLIVFDDTSLQVPQDDPSGSYVAAITSLKGDDGTVTVRRVSAQEESDVFDNAGSDLTFHTVTCL